MLVILLIKNSSTLTKLASNKATANFGRNTMSILIVHSICAVVLSDYLKTNGLQIPLFIVFLIWFIMVHASASIIAIPLRKAISFANTLIDKTFDGVSSYLRSKLNKTTVE